MHSKRNPVKSLIRIWPGVIAASTALATFPLTAAEGAALTPAQRPQVATVPATLPARVTVRVVNVPLQECPADDREGLGSVRAFIDPDTGKLRAPTREEEQALVRAIPPRAARQAQAARVPVVHANGIVSIEVGEDLMEDVVVRTGDDGKPVFLCTPRSETARALTRALAPKAGVAAEEEK